MGVHCNAASWFVHLKQAGQKRLWNVRDGRGTCIYIASNDSMSMSMFAGEMYALGGFLR